MQIGSILNGSLNTGATLTPKPAKASGGGYTDPKDTNQDGVVSAAEERAYALKHPEQAIAKRLQSGSQTTSQTRPQTGAFAKTSWNSYTPKGASRLDSRSATGGLDLYA